MRSFFPILHEHYGSQQQHNESLYYGRRLSSLRLTIAASILTSIILVTLALVIGLIA